MCNRRSSESSSKFRPATACFQTVVNFYVQELVAEQVIVVERCDTNFNLADIMTKALPVNKHITMANYFFRGEDPVSGRSLVTRNIIEM